MVKTTTVSHEQIHCRMFSRCFVLQTSKNFTPDNECSQLLLSIIFLAHKPSKWATRPISFFQRQYVRHKRMLVTFSTHTQHTHQHHPYHPQHRTHTVRQTQPTETTKTQTDRRRMDTDRHHIFRHTHLAQTHHTHITTTHTIQQHTQHNKMC